MRPARGISRRLLPLLTSLVLMTSLLQPCLGCQEAPICLVSCCTAQPSCMEAEHLTCECPDLEKLHIQAGDIPKSVESIFISQMGSLTIDEGAVYGLHSLTSFSLHDINNVFIEKGGLKLHENTSLSSFDVIGTNSLHIENSAFAGDWKDNTKVNLKDIETLRIAEQAFNYSVVQPGPHIELHNITTLDVASGAFDAFVRRLRLDHVRMPSCLFGTFNEKIDELELNVVVIDELKTRCFHYGEDSKISDDLHRYVTITSSTLKTVRAQSFSGNMARLILKQTELETVHERGFQANVSNFEIIESKIGTLHSMGLSITSDLKLSLDHVKVGLLHKNAFFGIWMITTPLRHREAKLDHLEIQCAKDGSLSLLTGLPLYVAKLNIKTHVAERCHTERWARRLLGADDNRQLSIAEYKVFNSLSEGHLCQETDKPGPNRTNDDEERCTNLSDEERQEKDQLAPICRISCCTAQPSCRVAQELNCTCPNMEQLEIGVGDIPSSVKSILISQVGNLTINEDAVHDLHSLASISVQGIGNISLANGGLKLHGNTSLLSFNITGTKLLNIDSHAFTGNWKNSTSVILKDIETLQIEQRGFIYTTVQPGPSIKMENITTLDMDSGVFHAFVDQLNLKNVQMPQCRLKTFDEKINSLTLNNVTIPDVRTLCFHYSDDQKINDGLQRNVTIKASNLSTVHAQAFSGNITSLKLEHTNLDTVHEHGFQVYVKDLNINDSKIGELRSRGLSITSGHMLSIRNSKIDHLYKDAFAGIRMITALGRYTISFDGLDIKDADDGSLSLPTCLPLTVPGLHIQAPEAKSERCPTERWSRRLLGADDHRPLRKAEYNIFKTLSDGHDCQQDETKPKEDDDDKRCVDKLQEKVKREEEEEKTPDYLDVYTEHIPDGRPEDGNSGAEPFPEVEGSNSYKTRFFVLLAVLVLVCVIWGGGLLWKMHVHQN